MGRLLTIRNGQNDGPLAFSHNFLTQQSIPAGFTFSRADAVSAATRFDSNRSINVLAANVARHDFHPITASPRGILLEVTRTNSIRNSNMTGLVAGTPGTLPTNWINFLGGGLAQQIVGTGTERGMPYIDWRVFGTTSSANICSISFDTTTGITAATGQIWTNSFWIKLVAGSLANISSSNIRIIERDAVGTTLVSGTKNILSSITATASYQTYTRTLANAGTLRVTPGFDINFTAVGVAIDATFRIYGTQMELGDYDSSFIRTTGSSVATRAAELLLGNTPVLGIASGDAVSVYAEIEYDALLTTSGQRIFELGVDTSNRMGVGIISGGNIGTYITNGGSSVTANGVVGPTAGTIYKVAATYRVGSCSICVNGGSVASVTAAAIPSYNKIAIGSAATSGSNLGGWVRAFGIQRGTITAATMQAITR